MPTAGVAVVAGIGTLLGAVLSAVTIVLVVAPDLAPATSNRAEIRNVVVEPDVTLDEYMSHLPVVESITDPAVMARLRTDHRAQLERVGRVGALRELAAGWGRTITR